MILKQIPEDFIVKELPDFTKGEGRYAIFLLKKKDYTTEKAIQQICKTLRIKRNRVGYAGIKDKHAVTEQYISIKSINSEKVEKILLKDIELKFIAYSKEPLTIGLLKGNSFEIVVRDLDKKIVVKKDFKIKNLFDEQRFSNNNAEIGLAILKKNFKKAVELVLENQGDYENDVRSFMEKHPTDFVGALQRIPSKILLLFVHAYQSLIFNKTIKSLNFDKNVKIPIVGFATEFENNNIKKIVEDLLSADKMSQHDFVIRSIPRLSSAGELRDLYVEPENLVVKELEKDDLNKNKYKLKLSFSLPKGCYATNVVKQIVKE